MLEANARIWRGKVGGRLVALDIFWMTGMMTCSHIRLRILFIAIGSDIENNVVMIVFPFFCQKWRTLITSSTFEYTIISTMKIYPASMDGQHAPRIMKHRHPYISNPTSRN